MGDGDGVQVRDLLVSDPAGAEDPQRSLCDMPTSSTGVLAGAARLTVVPSSRPSAPQPG